MPFPSKVVSERHLSHTTSVHRNLRWGDHLCQIVNGVRKDAECGLLSNLRFNRHNLWTLPDTHLSKRTGFIWFLFHFLMKSVSLWKNSDISRIQVILKWTHSHFSREEKAFAASEEFYSRKTAKQKAAVSSLLSVKVGMLRNESSYWLKKNKSIAANETPFDYLSGKEVSYYCLSAKMTGS